MSAEAKSLYALVTEHGQLLELLQPLSGIYSTIVEFYRTSLESPTLPELSEHVLTRYGVQLSSAAATELLCRLQWSVESTKDFVPISFRPLCTGTMTMDNDTRLAVTSWSFCFTCGLRSPQRERQHVGYVYTCRPTCIALCRAVDFKHGCHYSNLRHRDIESHTSSDARYPDRQVASILEWRRQQRALYDLPDTAGQDLDYSTMSVYAQPQREDWPVYDPHSKSYVEYRPELHHLESMLDLSEEACLSLRCINIFHRLAKEHGKQRHGQTYIWTKARHVPRRVA